MIDLAQEQDELGPTDASEIFGIDFSDKNDKWYMGDKGEIMDLDILNPMYNETRFRVRVNESTEPSDWQSDNIETAAKRRGAEGDYILHKGNYIFSNTETVLSNDEITHNFLLSDDSAIAEQEKEESLSEEKVTAEDLGL